MVPKAKAAATVPNSKEQDKPFARTALHSSRNHKQHRVQDAMQCARPTEKAIQMRDEACLDFLLIKMNYFFHLTPSISSMTDYLYDLPSISTDKSPQTSVMLHRPTILLLPPLYLHTQLIISIVATILACSKNKPPIPCRNHS